MLQNALGIRVAHVLFNVVTLKLNILNMGHGIHLGPEKPGAVPGLFRLHWVLQDIFATSRAVACWAFEDAKLLRWHSTPEELGHLSFAAAIASVNVKHVIHVPASAFESKGTIQIYVADKAIILVRSCKCKCVAFECLIKCTSSAFGLKEISTYIF